MKAEPPVVGFPRRRNDDGTIDSICPICYRTVAHETNPAKLTEMEHAHVCEDRHIKRIADAAAQ